MTMSKVTKPIGGLELTKRMIMLDLETVGRTARTSEIREAVTRVSPESAVPIYGCLGDLMVAGMVKKITFERDALMIRGEFK
jgi:hypothetical protein